ncbi:MAG: mercury methylation corrinoid protein HgcA [Thermoguttaceae bacterium]
MMVNNSTSQCNCCCKLPEDNSVQEVETIGTKLSLRDWFGFVAMRLDIGRSHYRVAPKLYSVGAPTDTSPILVTSNYKMTFDHLRSHLGGVNAWLLVLDTKGINVWCAAGKGTFGTDELVRQIESQKLSDYVSHRTLILPQLGAPGVAANEIKRRSGFTVKYGPIRAADIKAYLETDMKATLEMRAFEFPLFDRFVLAPLEIVAMLKWIILAVIFVLILSGFHKMSYDPGRIVSVGLPTAGLIIFTWIASAVTITSLLPYLPGRMLSIKGIGAGVLLSGALAAILYLSGYVFDSTFGLIGLGMVIVFFSGYMGLTLTGSMPYTSLSGVKKEMRIMLPVLISGGLLGFFIWILGRFILL